MSGNPEPIDARIAAIAATQHSVISRAQLLGLGLTRRRIAGRVRRGQLRVIHRGVYLVGPVAGPHTLHMAAVLALPRGVLSHWSAARFDDLPLACDDPQQVMMVAPTGARGRRGFITVLRTDNLHATEVRRVHGMPVTTTSRTLFDLATTLGRADDARRLEQLAATILDRKLATLSELNAVVQRHAQHRGAGLLRLILAPHGGPTLTRSEAEERLLALLRAAGLPMPQCNARVAHREVDCVWQKERLVVEIDGYEWHSSRNRFERDHTRDAALTAAGYTVLRFTWRQIDQEPQLVQGRLAFVLGRLSARPA